ncbi:serine protease SP24D [Drosophila biarmipes]|uniref:serine protease SP24D n=1 Tax=Drosophila biarmipes TaxID=125945 RepID=UPI0007E827D2|nr:serine protease SP24D [Drosophila biarmipes]XP_050743810.1 serine protease SP24D [Drosophila biarmipes]
MWPSWTLLLLLCAAGAWGQVQTKHKNDSDVEPRIVGGAHAKQGQFPHQISLRRRGSHTCGGSIISENYVVTAAHCVKQGSNVAPASELSVHAGSLLLSSGGVVVPVATVTVHPEFSGHGHDVAVLRLRQSLKLGSNMAAIQLATDDPPSDATVDISGWGAISQSGPLSNSLLFVQVKALSRETCRKEYLQQLPETTMCLMHPRNKGACYGDSGGPATYAGKLVGLASFVIGGCGRNAPDGYERVSQLRSWIREKASL